MPSNAAVIGIGLAMGVVVGGAIIAAPSVSNHAAKPDTYSAAFSTCHVGGGQNCVVDGDTAWVNGVKIRIMDIDAPETHPSRCATEQNLGDRATERLRALLNQGPFSLESGDRDEDKYGRKLRVITRGGRSLGAVLVEEGLAREWTGSRQPWC